MTITRLTKTDRGSFQAEGRHVNLSPVGLPKLIQYKWNAETNPDPIVDEAIMSMSETFLPADAYATGEAISVEGEIYVQAIQFYRIL